MSFEERVANKDKFHNHPNTVQLKKFLATKARERFNDLIVHRVEIPFATVAKYLDDLETMWSKILSHIPPDSTPDLATPSLGSVIQGLRNGEYSNTYCVLFVSEAFGRHPENTGGVICEVEVDWSYI